MMLIDLIGIDEQAKGKQYHWSNFDQKIEPPYFDVVIWQKIELLILQNIFNVGHE
jgi:hypothetical protein